MDFARAIELDPSNASSYNSRGLVHDKLVRIAGWLRNAWPPLWHRSRLGVSIPRLGPRDSRSASRTPDPK